VIQLPENINNSSILNNEEKQLLSSVAEIPVVDPAYEDDTLKNIFQYYSLIPDEMDIEVHKYAANLLHQGKVKDAWQVLLTCELI